jgi:hypothetical protein
LPRTELRRPDTFPDFTRCDQTTPEANSAWKDVIVHGGPARGFSEIMPAFGELLTNDEIDDVIAYLRSLCRNTHWARGELNLPRALITEKAFPESEEVISTAVNAHGAPGLTTDVIHEQRFGVHNQIEVDVPFQVQEPNQTWYGGVGDTTIGLKREMWSSLRTGSILSLFGGVIVPVGNKSRGLGAGTTSLRHSPLLTNCSPPILSSSSRPAPIYLGTLALRRRTSIGHHLGTELRRRPWIGPPMVAHGGVRRIA